MAFFVTAFSYVICYTVLFEGYYGRTVGKYLLGLKVMKEDGTKIGYREAILRNIPKYLSNFIVFDALCPHSFSS
ncbi:MAG: RDD family protein [Methanocella sp. PtaU1.Bin125]|nr:MAG: RDD family protein [Methanocella sp. PtaU1.Bin125]